MSGTFIKSPCESQPHTQDWHGHRSSLCWQVPCCCLLTTQVGQSVTTRRLGTRHCGVMGDLKVSKLQGLSYHKFLDSHAQEQSGWSRFSNNRWSASRDGVWSRALPNPSVRNSSSYFFPLMWTWQPLSLGTFLVSFHVPWRAWAQMTFHRAVSLEASRRSTSQNASRSRL